MEPILTIITINFNNAAGLQQTLESIAEQSLKPSELIVIDGGSTDGSGQVVDRYKSMVSFFVSEPDSGIYHAQNKGLKNAKGNYLMFLNAGDALMDADVLKQVIPLLNGTDIVYGDLLICGGSANREWVKKYNEPITFSYFLGDTLPHQGSFIKRSLFDQVGHYDETLQISADWKFFLEAVCLYNASLKYLNFTVAKYDYTGLSSRPEGNAVMVNEKRAYLEKRFPRFITDYDELIALRCKYPLLANSRMVKAYFSLRKLFHKNQPA